MQGGRAAAEWRRYCCGGREAGGTVFLTTFLPFFGASSFLSKKPMTTGLAATVGARTAAPIADGFTKPAHLLEAWHVLSAVGGVRCVTVCAARVQGAGSRGDEREHHASIEH